MRIRYSTNINKVTEIEKRNADFFYSGLEHSSAYIYSLRLTSWVPLILISLMFGI